MQPTVTEAAAGPEQDPFAPLVVELERRLPAAEVEGAADLLRRAYASTPPEELAELGADAVVGPIVALWKLGQQRQPGKPTMRVYNPQPERDGWSSPHTAIDVVNDDMAFLLASTRSELMRQQRTIHMVLHPVLGVERRSDGTLVRLLPRGQGAGESWMHFEIDRETAGEAGLAALAARLSDVLGKVRVVVEDWPAMVAKAEELAAELRREPPPVVPVEEAEEAAEFLRWLADNHFTMLGYRRYRLERGDDGSRLRIPEEPGLGIHREVAPSEERRGARLPDYLDSWLRQRELLIINKASTKSEVHRPVHIDSIGIRRYDAQGNVVAEDRFSGIFTTTVYSASATTIPVVRRKVHRVEERADFKPGSHDAKSFLHVIESFPRDELFQISEDDLFRMAMGILHLHQRQRVALFVRRDELERFISALVFVPRDRYNAELRDKLGKVLERELGGPVVAFYTTVGDAPLARVQYILVTKPGEVPAADLRQVEVKLAVAARTWREELRAQLTEAHGEEKGLQLLGAWGDAFPAVYRDRFGIGDAVADVGVVEAMLDGGDELQARLYRTAGMPAERMRVKLYLAGRQVPLTDALPLLENLGVRVEEELPFEVRLAERQPGAGAQSVWIHDFALVARPGAVDFDTAKPLVEETLRRVWRGELENGVLNRLVLAAGLHWRQLAMLRAYSRYLRQIGMTFSQTYIANTMVQHREVSQLLAQLFCTLFDPAQQDDSRSRAAATIAEVRDRLESVQSLDEDRILRGFLAVIKETLRTNFFQTTPDGHHKPYLSFKLDSRSIRQLPDPKPRFEIFVYSPRMEGVHLRGGMVARGGIRWSDRREDFRTEILGLLKAQMVKNAVIVPVGSKGGFVCKKPPTSGGREAQLAEGIECYKTLLRGMLDVT
ncbi:MAG TPA: NAD-glutamate dehydrogenase domain-containing protein, partial [Thermoanaerobaculia bacterium]|nr:NAD-glutamate dehydrogenase domain-containing protein [Thermoanaerobaculia bacterium]